MGERTTVYFRPGTKHRDVMTVLSALVGGETWRNDWKGYSGWSVEVKRELICRPSHTPTMITLEGDIRGAHVYCHYHFESAGPLYGPVLSTGAVVGRTPVWVALADFFGAMIDLNDTDAINIDFVGSLDDKPYPLHPNDGDGWNAFQEAVLAVGAVVTPEQWNYPLDRGEP